jgi:hypothetical protein
MLGNYFYHKIIHKTVVAFGTLFNNIEIQRLDSSGAVEEVMKVPLAYGPTQKFLARLNQNPDPTNKRVEITLPRISFEMTSIDYDSTRKVAPTNKIKIPDSLGQAKTAYMPVPYNLEFEVGVIAKTQDDSLQIIEQILPFFQPHFNLSIKLIEEINEIRDIPITLSSINYSDEYEGGFTTRRALIYTLKFTAKTYLYGPVVDATPIRKAIVDSYTSMDQVNAPRVQRYQVTPKATVDYNASGSITSDDDPFVDPDDNFGFNEISSEFTNIKKRNPVTGLDEDIP